MTPNDVLDRLVPPPWTGGRRLAAAGVAVVVVVAAFAVWWSGLLGPNLASISGFGWGPTAPVDELDWRSGTVGVQLELDNRGWFDVVIDDLHADFLTGARVTFDGPATIPAGGRGRLHFDLVVEACHRFEAPTEPMLTFSGRSGPVPVAGRSLPMRVHHPEPASWDDAPIQGRASWWYQLAQSVCDPDSVEP